MTRSPHANAREGVPRGRARLREVSDDGETPLATVGQDLRNARLAGGEDLGSVSYALKIRKDHLEAIEEDRFDALPGRTYAVGFVRAYADYAGLDPAEAVERFKMEIAGRDEVSKTAGFPEEVEEPGLSGGWIVIGIIVLGLIAYGVYYLFSSGTPESRQPVAAVPSQISAQHKPMPPSKPISEPAVRDRAPAPAPQMPASQMPASAVNSPSPATKPPSVAPGPGGQVYGKMNTNAQVVLRVTQPTRILVQTEDGREFINRELQPGDIYRVPNMHGLALTAEHGNAVQIVVDGKAVGMAGKTADPTAALPLDQEAVTGRRGGSASQ